MKFKKNLALLKTTLFLLSEISPGHLKLSMLRGVISAILPFIPIYMSGVIVDELTYGKNFKTLILLAVITVMATFIGNFGINRLTQRIEVLENMFDLRFVNYLNEAKLAMKYAAAEDAAIAQKREKILSQMFATDGGIDTVISRLEKMTENSLTFLAAILVSAQPVWQIVTEKRPLTALFPVIVLVLLVVASVWFSIKNSATAEKKIFALHEQGAVNNNYVEYYNNIYLEDDQAGKDVRIFDQRQLIVDEIQQKARIPWLKITAGTHQINQRYLGFNAVIAVLLSGAVYLFVGLQAMIGRLSLGNVIQVYGSITKLTHACIQLFTGLTQFRNNTRYLSELLAFIDLQKSQCPAPGGKVVPPKGPWIFEFHDVSFKYPKASEATLKNISFKIEPNEKVALVGMNGSGKTTLVKLLCRLYEPTAGYISLNGCDIKEYDPKLYAELFAVVFQDFQLFAFSIAENIALTKPLEARAMWTALAGVGLKARIEQLPQQEFQQVSKRFDAAGIDFSGGESQKIALARALYQAAPIMILDEPTAALDPISEAEIYEKFKDIPQQKTCLFITHRLSSCKFCDKILVLDQGEILQVGTHQELLALSTGKYFELWQAQAQYYQG